MLVLTEEVMKQIFISTLCIEALAIKYNSASISLFFCFSSLTIIMLTFSPSKTSTSLLSHLINTSDI